MGNRVLFNILHLHWKHQLFLVKTPVSAGMRNPRDVGCDFDELIALHFNF